MEEHKIANKDGSAAKFCEPVSVAEIASGLTEEAKSRLLARYNMKDFAKVFEDSEICETCINFLNCGLNVSLTARVMYMHRNTLIYRLDKVRALTGLDVREPSAAVTFELLYRIYAEKRSSLR